MRSMPSKSDKLRDWKLFTEGALIGTIDGAKDRLRNKSKKYLDDASFKKVFRWALKRAAAQLLKETAKS